MKKAVVLLSGGLDSATVLALAVSKGYDVYALSFSYGQAHHAELQAAKKITNQFNVVNHQVLELNFGQLAQSALTNKAIQVPDYNDSEGIPLTYVPARNTVFLSIALGWAESVGAQDIFVGVSAIDYSNYPDCRPEYIRAFQAMANLATKTGVEGKPITIHAPLIELSKAETVRLGLQLGVNYQQTVSCYRLSEKGEACGKCDSCVLRKKGFSQAGIDDPTRYLA